MFKIFSELGQNLKLEKICGIDNFRKNSKMNNFAALHCNKNFLEEVNENEKNFWLVW